MSASGPSVPLHGEVTQSLTLNPDKKSATEFFPDEVDGFLNFFMQIANSQLVGGHVTRYTHEKQAMPNGRIVVKVIQYVE